MNSATALDLSSSLRESAIIEQPVDVEPESGLFGVLTRPQTACRETCFVLINSGLLHRVGPFRLYVDIARSLARSGFPSIRLDQSGKGDSDALRGASLLDATVSNLTAAARLLEHETGASECVIGGLCSGADDALQAAADIDRLAGVFMFDGYLPRTARFYLHRYGPKLLSVRAWSGRLQKKSGTGPKQRSGIGNMRNWAGRDEMMQRYRNLMRNDIRLLAIYSGWPGNNCAYRSQLTNAIGHPRAAALVSEHRFPDATHLFHLSSHRRAAVKCVVDWAEQSF
jgi:hypothetical protein